MPRVLLYEPGITGHRPVILRYLTEGLPETGWEPVVLRDPQFSQLKDEDLCRIEEEARRQGCELVHLLTIDGCAKNWLKPRRPGGVGRLPVLGTYYLFNNLWGANGLAWMAALCFGYIDSILISDPFLRDRLMLPGLRSRVGFIPDPWSRKDFPFIDRMEARMRLGLPLDKKLILVFGEISQRKGVKRILEALHLIKAKDFKIVFAGQCSEDAKEYIEAARADSAIAGKLVVHDHHIKEEDVSAYFHSADAILSDYPRWFRVSSGVFTRAIAANRLPIFPDHGVNAAMIEHLGFGRLYEAESIGSLAAAVDGRFSGVGEILSNKKVADEARRRELASFLAFLALEYKKITIKPNVN